jgi:hypothetical protein
MLRRTFPYSAQPQSVNSYRQIGSVLSSVVFRALMALSHHTVGKHDVSAATVRESAFHQGSVTLHLKGTRSGRTSSVAITDR